MRGGLLRGTLRRIAREEQGFTLIELTLTAVLGSVVMGIAGAMLVAGMQAQRTVTSSQGATQVSALIDASVSTAVRNSTAVWIAPAGASGLASGDGFAEVATFRASAGGAQSWRCMAWFYKASTQTLYLRGSTSAIPSSAASSPSMWTALDTRIQPVSDSIPVLARDAASGGLTVSFRVDDGSSGGRAFTTTAVPQLAPDPTWGAASCAG